MIPAHWRLRQKVNKIMDLHIAFVVGGVVVFPVGVTSQPGDKLQMQMQGVNLSAVDYTPHTISACSPEAQQSQLVTLYCSCSQ